MMDHMQSGIASRAEDLDERIAGVGLVAREPDRYHAFPSVGFGQPQRCPGTLDRPATGVIQHYPRPREPYPVPAPWPSS